jgi:transposase
MGVAIGIDSHKSSLEGGVLDELGRVVATGQFRNDAGGHAAALAWIRTQDSARVIGIEGSGGYGAALARVLLDAGEDVNEVPAFVTHRERRKAPSRGKSDPADAVAIARVAARGEGLCPPRQADVYEDLKLLTDARDLLVKERTQLINRIHADLVVLAPGYEARLPKLTAKTHITQARKLMRGHAGVRAELVRERLIALERLHARTAEITRRLVAKVIESGTGLTRLSGVGFVTAAKILGEVGDPARLRSRDTFAMLNGSAPLEASSGSTKRHRLNRGGNRNSTSPCTRWLSLVPAPTQKRRPISPASGWRERPPERPCAASSASCQTWSIGR